MGLGPRTIRLAALGLWAGLALPFLRRGLEGEMVTHMLLQLPLLGLAGWLIGASLRERFHRAGPTAAQYRLALIIVGLVGAAFWMLPRWLDAALGDPRVELLKFVSVPLLVGLPLGVVWPGLSLIGKGFILANTVSMLALVGWLFTALPIRLCARYRLDQQQIGGTLMLIASVAITLTVLVTVLRGSSPPRDDDSRADAWAPHAPPRSPASS